MSTASTYEIGPVKVSRERLFNGLTYVIMYGAALLFTIPFWRMIVRSFTSMQVISSKGVEWIPPSVSFRVWEEFIFQEPLIITWAINTFIIATVTTLLVVFIDSLVAFSITRLNWPGQRIVFGVIVASFMVPAFVNMIPLYQVVNELGLIDTLPAVILPFTALPLGVFLLVQFFRDIPVELEEAARLDGFSTLRIYTHIILPLARPILTALSLFIFVWSWNQFLWPLIVLQSDSNYTLAVGVVTVRNSHLIQVNLTMATMLVAAAPLFIVFLIFQDKLISAVQLQAGH